MQASYVVQENQLQTRIQTWNTSTPEYVLGTEDMDT